MRMSTLACVLVRIWAFGGMSSTPFHNFLFYCFAELMLLWQLIKLDCDVGMLAGL